MEYFLIWLAAMCLLFAWIPIVLYRFNVVSRRRLKPFRQALERPELTEPQRQTIQMFVDQSNSNRQFFYVSLILIPALAGWGLVLALIWLIHNGSVKSQWRIATGCTPVQYARKFGPLLSDSYKTDQAQEQRRKAAEASAAQRPRDEMDRELEQLLDPSKTQRMGSHARWVDGRWTVSTQALQKPESS
jgi:hypothetical protein